MDINKNKDTFINWAYTTQVGPRTLDAIKDYARVLERIEEITKVEIGCPVFEVGDEVKLAEVVARIKGMPDYVNFNRHYQNGIINAALGLFTKYIKAMSKTEEIEIDKKDDEAMNYQNAIDSIVEYIKRSGFSFDSHIIKNYYLCLKSKPFVILAGTSGTGKSKLVKLFAEAIGADYSLIPVRPDWSDSSDLIGHTDLQGNYITGDLLKAIRRAADNPQKPHFVCLDEMNMARVEYYLSDFLSLIETRERKGEKIVTIPLKMDETAGKEYSGLCIPENLYIVGTVNMDETTFPFSKKVLDRANTIEFSDVDLIPNFTENGKALDAKPIKQNNDFLKSKYLVLKIDIKSEQQDFVTELCVELQKVNKILEKANAHVGYRVRDEIVFYMLNNLEAELLKRDEAFDFEIMQKILPRIQGSTTAVKDLLIDLFKEFGGDFTTGSSDLIWKQMQSYIGSDKPKKYPKSVQKICYMMRKIEEDGFTSYWI